jgi:2-desacetyl-2-hydroxyethyl bacteriochlorophyllide A dehydrogenase
MQSTAVDSRWDTEGLDLGGGKVYPAMLRMGAVISGGGAMGIQTRAVVFTKPGEVEVQPIELPEPDPGEVVVRTLFSGISPGTELWSLTGKYWSTVFPTIPGYQKAGVVERVGPKVSNLAEGDVIFLRFSKVPPGTNIEWAGHTGHSVVSADDPEVFRLPEGLAPEQASLLCMVAVGYHGAAEVMPVHTGETVIVIGLGLIGQFSAQTAALRGAKVIAVEPVAGRLALAATYARAVPVNPAKEDPTEAIRALCPDGADAVIDTSANPDAVNASFHWIRDKGRYCLQGYYPGMTSLDLLWPHAKELTFYNPTNVTPEGEKHCAQLLADGTMHLGPMITHVKPAEEAPAMYDMLLNRREEGFGVVLDWRE